MDASVSVLYNRRCPLLSKGEPMSDTTECEHGYQTGDLAKTLGVSRASLAYYEKMGLVHPNRDEATGVRSYSNEDVFDLFSYAALGNIGLTARQVASEGEAGPGLFGEQKLEEYLRLVTDRLAWYSALRDAIDRMRAIRLRDRAGAGVELSFVERHIFIEDGAEKGYDGLRRSRDLDALGKSVPVAGFGILLDFNEAGNPTWRWGRTVPVKVAPAIGLVGHYDCEVGGCECVTSICRTPDVMSPPTIDLIEPLYDEARRLGREPAGNPFVPYVFPPHANTPYEICLPLAQR